jgi:hypothetical protein
MESRTERKLAPQNSQRSLRGVGPLVAITGVSAETDSIFFVVLIVIIVLLGVLLSDPISIDGRMSRSFPLVAADVEKLLADSMFRRMDVLNIRLE